MKKIFQKNQIIIIALAMMIIIAGYLQFSQRGDEEPGLNVGDNNVLDYDSNNETAGDNLLDSDLVDSLLEGTDVKDVINENQDADDAAKDNEEDEYADISDEDIAKVSDTGEVIADAETDEEGDDKAAPGEAVLVNTTVLPDYFANAKLVREQDRAKSKETLMGIIDNAKVTEKEREAATAEIIKLTTMSEKERSTETLLEAKGYSDAVVILNDDGKVDVIVNAASLTEQDIAQIEDIVKRKAEVETSQIIISPAVAKE
jgi:stage III sporulation protein AH